MLSERLKQLRKRDGLSQTEFAKKFNISTGTIGNWETGAREPDASTMMKIAKFFNVTVDYLLGETDNPGKPMRTTDDVKVALFGGDGEVTDEMWDEVVRFAEFVKSKHSKGDK